MKIERVDRVVGGEFLAVRKGHALAQVEDPVLGAVIRLPALRQLRMGFPVLAPFGEAIPEPMVGVDEHGICSGAEIEAVGGAAARKAELQHAALFGGLSGDRVGARQHCRNRDARRAERGGAAHKLAARNGAMKQAPVPIIQFAHLARILSMSAPFPIHRSALHLPAVYPRLGVRISVLSIAPQPALEESVTNAARRADRERSAYLAGMDGRRFELVN